MLEKFLKSENLMKLALWFYRHQGEYLATTIQDDLEMDSFELVRNMHLLDTMGVCKVTPDGDEEELHVKINSESELLYILRDLEDFLEIQAAESSEIESVLNMEDTRPLKELLNVDSSLSFEELLANCKANSVDDDVDITKEDIIKFLVIFSNVFGVE